MQALEEEHSRSAKDSRIRLHKKILYVQATKKPQS
jgi:hypothetical protein